MDPHPRDDASLSRAFEFAGGITLRNRIIMAPMTTYSADRDGTISEEELTFYRDRARGAGMLLSGCTHVTPNGVGFVEEFAAYDDRFLPSLRNLAAAMRSGGGAAVLQIFHAGSKGVPERIPDGIVVSSGENPAPRGGQMCPVSRALESDEVDDIVRDFGQTARRAIDAGFDGVELHGAHGFLLQDFLSPLTNRRTDRWGGTAERRSRFGAEAVREVRRLIDAHADRPFVLGYRITVEESAEGGLRLEDSLDFIDTLIESGIDYIHVSLKDVLTQTSVRVGHETLAERVRDRVAGRIPVICAGGVLTPEQARRVLDTGLSAAVVGRGLVMNAEWAELAVAGRDDRIHTTIDMGRSADELGLPPGLCAAIEGRPGWFPLSHGDRVAS
ncbi:NADH-dependent flavin oxidoreductase [Brevibacterium sp. VCM10]|uniref:NADH-dependent flavin oxidoreductase n=1 Tax=Brevibacterium sp. VCM10 TaxID=1381751 RepID=UPI000470FC22|nr:NADH-dependent flavin oxidoreductase [Brevibacterium sp. VCM10]